MGRNLQPLRSCDLCEFSSRNRYLFKRHFNRCRRHKKFKLFESGAKSIKPSTSLSKETMESSPELEENPLVIKEDPINQEMSEAADDTSMDVDDSSLIEGSPMNHSFDEFPEISGSSSAGGILPPPNVCRNYHCQECSFTTTKSKMFLYHQIDVHSANFNVFPCDFCEYASRWKHKLLRHKEKAHKVTVTMEELQPEYTASKTPPVPTSPKPKKPSLPAKYTTSNPTIKLKKSRTHLSKNNNLDSCSMYIERLSTIFNGASVFKCKLCLYTSKTRMQAYKHVYSCHVKAKVFKCKVCSFSTEKKIDFYIHKSKHTNENFYQCKECLYGTTLKTNYDRHMLNHEMTSAFTCNLCSYSSPNEGALKRHLTNHHSNSEENVSLIVSKTSAANAVDIKTHPDEKPLRGSFSGVGENSVAVAFEEQNEKVDTDDEHDDDDNNNDDDDDDNNNSNNNSGGESSNNNNGSRLQRFQKSFCYRCRICGLKYKRSPDMNRHMKLKHNISIQEFKKLDLERQYQVLNSVDNDNAENNDSNEENFRGGDEDGGPLDLSIKTMRSIFSKTKLKCTYCSYIAKWPCDLRRHMAVHSVDKRYKCHLCMRKYKYFGDLNVHIRRDHDIEPDKSLIEKVTTVQKKKSSPTIFKCPSCSFTSNYKSEIDRHSKLHDGNKPYKCKLCKYQSHWKGDMNRHLYRHHPNEVQQEDDIKNLVIYQKVINPELIASNNESSTDTPTASATVTVAAITSTSTTCTSTSPTATPTSTSIKETSAKLALSSADENLDVSEARAEEITRAECSTSTDGVSNFEIVKEDNTKIGLRSPELDHVSMAMVTKETGSSSFTDVTDDSHQKDVVGPFLCKYCDFSAPAPSKLKAHLATHLNLKKFKCPICGKRSNWKWDIRKHIRKEHPGQSDDVIVMSEQEAEATVLKYMETMPTNRREHQLNVAMLKPKKLFKCSQCNFQSAFRWTVLKHLRNDHADNASSRITENSGCESVGNSIIIGEVPETIVKIEPGTIPPKAIASQTISTSSGKPASLASFVPKPAVVSGSGTPVLSVPMISKLKSSKKDSKSSSDKPYMCPLCGKRTTFRGDVRKHYRYMHPGEEIRILYVGTLSNEEILSKTNVIKMSNTPSPIKKEKMSVSGGEASKSETSVRSPQSASDTTLILASDKLKDTPEHTTALEALYSNPKRVGYIKPFKCSACGRRSNWKWDLKKHIRERHPEDGYVIVMEEEEARRSLLAVCYPNHPLVTKQADGAATSDASLTPVTSAAQRNAQKMWRQFECSGCGYKSNWRSDVYRHIKRRHNNNRSKIICIDHKTSDYPPPFDFKFKKSESSYEKKSVERNIQTVSLEDGTASTTEIAMVPGLPQTSQPATTQTESGSDSVSLLGHGKLWKCNKCSYRHKDKMLVMRHLTSHKVKPYKCKLCGHSSNYRSALYRHLRQKHGRNDYSLCKLSISYSADSEGTAASGDENDTGIGDLLDLYTCKICKFQSTWKACLYRHLREQHGTTDYNNCFMKTSTENGVEEKPAPIEIRVPLPDRSSDKPNRFQCNVCPYSTKKQALLKFHMSYHKPRGQNRFKCKFCPYYVCARRLLNQHIRLHSNELAKNKMSSKSPESPASPSPSPSKKEEFLSTLDINVSPKTPSSKRMRYSCEKCPYTTNSKNDFLYHKQFHRVKLSNTAAFKCDYCDYWVSHRRLLKQHLRLHSSPEPDCIQSSPAKSEPPDINLMYDAVEIASVKQKLISSKILPKLTPNEEVGSPLKIAARFATFGDKSGYICKNGVYKKLLKCPKCPYTNIRLRNLRLHQQMHGLRSSAHPLLKCPHCDYYVGSKGLLSHHLKVHQHQYVPDPNDDTISEMEMMEGINLEGEDLDDKEMEISQENRVDALIEIAHFKKFCCERCPYASAKRMHFERHIELHGSKQRYTCDYCDYSVPSNNLLVQHRKLHFSPNPNLVATQSISNLQRLPEIPADLALASVLPPMDSNDLTPLAVTHDHLNLYENEEPEKDDTEPKKLYRCDRCPYSNTRRDHMLTHLKFHMIQSELACPYCDYSVSKNHLLSQHIRVHFSPLPELSNWLTENGQKHRIEQAKDQDLSEALHIAQLYQQNKKQAAAAAVNAEIPAAENTTITSTTTTSTSTSTTTTTTTTTTNNNNNDDNSNLEEQSSLVCQYCDRSFTDSAAVLKHERQHLIGNQFECCILQNMAELAPAVATC